ncbi:hypothetical protein THAOC_00287, partial [Thalassiosira oceanica]
MESRNKRARLPSAALDGLCNDLLVRCASYLDADGLAQLGRTNARFGIPQAGQQRSLANEAARQWFLEGANHEEMSRLPKYDDESDIGLLRALEQLRQPLCFDELAGAGFGPQEHPASVTCTIFDGWSTAVSGHVMRGGRHFVEFTINDALLFRINLGIIRPVSLTDGIDSEADWGGQVTPVAVTSNFRPAGIASPLDDTRLLVACWLPINETVPASPLAFDGSRQHVIGIRAKTLWLDHSNPCRIPNPSRRPGRRTGERTSGGPRRPPRPQKRPTSSSGMTHPPAVAFVSFATALVPSSPFHGKMPWPGRGEERRHPLPAPGAGRRYGEGGVTGKAASSQSPDLPPSRSLVTPPALPRAMVPLVLRGQQPTPKARLVYGPPGESLRPEAASDCPLPRESSSPRHALSTRALRSAVAGSLPCLALIRRRPGSHYVEFEINNDEESSEIALHLGVIRPVSLTDGIDFEVDWEGTVNPVHVSSTWQPAVAEKLRSQRTAKWGVSNVHCCTLNSYHGRCYWTDWDNEDSYSDWQGQERMPESGTIGLLLDLDEGTLSVFKNGRRLGVMKDGLGGDPAPSMDMASNTHNDLLCIPCAISCRGFGTSIRVRILRVRAVFWAASRAGQQRSLTNEAARQRFKQSASDEEISRLPKYYDESDVGLLRALEEGHEVAYFNGKKVELPRLSMKTRRNELLVFVDQNNVLGRNPPKGKDENRQWTYIKVKEVIPDEELVDIMHLAEAINPSLQVYFLIVACGFKVYIVEKLKEQANKDKKAASSKDNQDSSSPAYQAKNRLLPRLEEFLRHMRIAV